MEDIRLNFTIGEKCTPLDIPGFFYDVNQKPIFNRWYRIPSWKIHFNDGILKNIDLRIHKKLECDNGWVISEGTTGFSIFGGDFDPPEELNVLLVNFYSDFIPRLTQEVIDKAMQIALTLVKKLPPR